MLSFVFDADGVIKVAKAGILEEVAKKTRVIVPTAVLREVLRGKEKMFEDAFLVETMVKNKMLHVVEEENQPRASYLGEGEQAALSVLNKTQADAIITDDRKFISILEEEHIPFVIPSDLIVLLFKKKYLPLSKAKEALERLRPMIREDLFENAKYALGGNRL